MSINKVYASFELADREVRLIVLEIFEGQFNVLRVERVACDGIQNQKIVDETSVVQAIRKASNNANAALGYRIERALLAIPSVNVQHVEQRVHVQVEDGTKYIRLFHIQQGLNKAVQKKISDDIELVNIGRITYEVDGQISTKMPISAPVDEFYMNVELLFADKDTIYSFARCIEQANMEILDIYLDAYAIAQESAVAVKSQDRLMIQLDLEADHCVLTLFSHGLLYSSTVLEHGYRWFIEEIKEQYGLSDAVCFRLLQNVFNTEVDPALDKIIYIEQRSEQRIEITAHQLTEVVFGRIKEWIHDVNDACEPILQQGPSEFVLTGKGANIGIFNQLTSEFRSNATIYAPQNVGARDASFTCCIGVFYAYNDINKIRHSNKICANVNELGASIDAINHKARNGEEGGFTKKLKSVILSENKVEDE